MPNTLHVVTLEDLSVNYNKYNNKIIIIAGTVIVGEEMSTMLMPIPTEEGRREGMWISLLRKSRADISPLEEKFFELSNRNNVVNVILEGKFNSSSERSFGHQNCCRFNFEITKIISVG
jgi:hypothetical protein